MGDAMEHAVHCGGTAFAVTGGTCLADATAYEIREGRTRVDGTVYALPFGPTILEHFADNSWEAIIWACRNNAVPDTWAADGSCSKEMQIGGTSYHVDIIGKNHDHYPDGTTAPLTFQLHEVSVDMDRMDPLWGGMYYFWEGSELRERVLPAFLAQMPPAVQEAIREVSKETAQSYRDGTITVTLDKLFLLSEYEASGDDCRYAFPGEGTPYAYYLPASNITRQKATPDAAAASYWTRSPVPDNLSQVVIFNSYGWSGSITAQASTYHICPAFCF